MKVIYSNTINSISPAVIATEVKKVIKTDEEIPDQLVSRISGQIATTESGYDGVIRLKGGLDDTYDNVTRFSTYSALVSAHPTNTEAIYVVGGSADEETLYVYNTASHEYNQVTHKSISDDDLNRLFSAN